MLTTLDFLAINFSRVTSGHDQKSSFDPLDFLDGLLFLSLPTFSYSPLTLSIFPHEILKREYLNGVKKWTRQFFLARTTSLVKVHYLVCFRGCRLKKEPNLLP